MAMKPLALPRVLGSEVFFPLVQWLVSTNSLKYDMKKYVTDKCRSEDLRGGAFSIHLLVLKYDNIILRVNDVDI